MKQKLLLKTMLLLCALVVGSSVWGQATVGTTLWAETWTEGTTSEKPSEYGFEGTTVYGGATLTYAQSSDNTKLYAEKLAGGDSPELLLSKSNQTWTISNIPTGQATEMTLTFKANKTTFAVTSSTTGITISGSGTSWTISQSTNINNFNLTIKNTGSSNARIDDVSLTVKTAAAAVTTLSVKTAPTKVRYEVGETLDMTGFVLDADGKDVSTGYTMTMGDAAIANGATLSSAGKKTITVTYGGKTVNQAISVGSVTGIAVTTAPTKTSYDTGDTFDPTGMVVTASLGTGELSEPDTWTKPVTGYTYSPDGALAPANTSVTITYSGQTTTQAITVTNVAVTGVSVKASTTIEKTKTETLTPTFTPANATNKAVTWESDNTSVATVSAAGVVTAVTAGTANITVTTDDGGKTATCVVTVVNKKGGADAPYSVAEIEGQATATTFGDDIYVTGYIVGCINSNKCYKTTTASLVNTNLLLADTPDKSFSEGDNVTSTTGMIPVQLGTTALQNAWGFKSNNVFGYKVILKGDAASYFGIKGIKGTSEITAVSVPATLNASGYATFASTYALDFTDDSQFSAWQITDVTSSTINFSQIKSAVAAGTGVLLKGTASSTINIPVAATGTDISATNKLEGITTATAIAADTYYGLSGNKFVKVNAGTVKAGKALLPASAITAGARELQFVFEDETTAIRGIENGQLRMENSFFDLQGRKIAQPTKGLYIKNGKKVFMK